MGAQRQCALGEPDSLEEHFQQQVLDRPAPQEVAPARAVSGVMLTCADLAARWGVDIKTIYEGIKLKQIPVVRIGRKVIRIALAVVERIEQGRVEPHGGNHGR